MEYIPLRHAVFKIEPDSANHTSRIIFNSIDRKKHLYDLLNDYHTEFSQNKPGGADELRQLIKDARVKWSIQLRETNCRDIRVMIAHEYFGTGPTSNIMARVIAIKRDLEAVGGKAYHHYPFNKKNTDNPWAVLDVVVPRAGIEAVLSKQRMTAHAIAFDDITAPAEVDYQPRQPDPECQFWYRDEDDKVTVLPTPKDTVRHRSNTVDRLREAKPGAWNPFNLAQQEWNGRKPFSAEIYEPESNHDWIGSDFAKRCEELEQYDKSLKSSPDSGEDGATISSEPYPSMSSAYPYHTKKHSEKPNIIDIQRDFANVEKEIATIEKDVIEASKNLNDFVKGGEKTREEIRASQQHHDLLYATLQRNKIPALRNVLSHIATDLMHAKAWDPEQHKRKTVIAPKPRKTMIMQSANGSTIWEETIPDVGETGDLIVVGSPPKEDKAKTKEKWAWIQRLFAGAGRKKPTPPPAVVTPALQRSDSAVSFSAGVAEGVPLGGIGEGSRPVEVDGNPIIRYV